MKKCALLFTSLALVLCITLPAAADWSVNDTARALAGLNGNAWKGHKKKHRLLKGYSNFINRGWRTYTRKVLSTISTWAAAELKHDAGETVFYPFSGPDFITSNRFYPKANRHVLVALQKGGRVPKMASFGSGGTYIALKLMKTGMRRFLGNGFFVTSRMDKHFKKGTQLEGITPIMMLFAVREGYTIKEDKPIRVKPDGTDVEVHPGDHSKRKTWNSVRFVLNRADGSEVLLDYLHLNLLNGNLRKHKHHSQWLAKMAKNRVVLKAASHLMQTKNFTRIRDIILNNAKTILQDDSGVYYTHLARRFEVSLYGDYETPNELFVQKQTPLKRAFSKRDKVQKLPFKYGYRKAKGSCLLVGHTRKAAKAK